MAENKAFKLSVPGLARASLIVVFSLPLADRFVRVRFLSTLAFLIADFVIGIVW